MIWTALTMTVGAAVWGLWLLVVAVGVVNWLWRRWPWRKPTRPYGVRLPTGEPGDYEGISPNLRRIYQRAEMKAVEARGPVWTGGEGDKG